MTTTPTIWSGPIVFDPNPLGIDTAPQLLTLSDDSFVLGWEDGNRIFGRHFDPFGSFTSGNFLAALGTGSDKLIQPLFVEANGSDVVVVYNEKPSGQSDYDTFWRQVDSDFISVTGGGTIVGPSAANELILAASSSVTGSAIVYSNDTQPQGVLLLTFVDGNGLPSTNDVVIPHAANTIQLNPAMEGTFFGAVAVAYTDFSVANGAVIHMQVYQRDSLTGGVNNVSGDVIVSGNNLGTGFADIAHWTSQSLEFGFIVAWQDNFGIDFRQFDRNGAALGNTVHVAVSSGGDAGAQVTSLNDGSFILAWRHDFGATGDGIVLQRYSINAIAIGDPIIIDDAGDEGSFGMQLETLADGRVVVAYTNGPADPATAVTTLDYLILDPRETTINGSDDGDTIVGRQEASIINGLGNVDTLLGMNGNDKLDGGTGDDILAGGKGKDELIGGIENDKFDFNSTLESRVRKGDVIKDFDAGPGEDLIDLRDIDAKTGGANNKFVFIGTNGFHHKAGELHFVKHNKAGTAHDTTVVEGDVNGNGRADFQIILTGLHNLKAGDFLL
jgi:Ca2+-binding RTX toxin-like protein